MVIEPKRRRTQVLILHAVMVPLALLWLFPIFTMAIYATLPDTAIYQPGLRIWPSEHLWANLVELQEATSFLRTLVNSFFVALIYAALSMRRAWTV